MRFQLDQQKSSSWIVPLGHVTGAGPAMFCFPFAGGGASIFRKVLTGVTKEILVYAVQPPGREARLRETALRTVKDLAAGAKAEIIKSCDGPFSFFGYSLGAIVAYEVAKSLQEEGKRGPDLLMVGASPAPQNGRRVRRISSLNDLELIRELRDLRGTPSELLDDAEAMKVLLPAVRADFEAAETYAYKPSQPLTCPIAVLGGIQDSTISLEEYTGWNSRTISSCCLHMLPGDHFFLLQAPLSVLSFIEEHVHCNGHRQQKIQCRGSFQQ
jgi:medium-chain acyl-[acyl-carrier-protein] hydrolase